MKSDTNDCSSIRGNAKNANDDERKRKRSGTEQIYRVLKGSYKYSDYSTFSLLVPEQDVSMLLETLEKAKHRLFDWSICEEEIKTVEAICMASSLGVLPIRSIEKESLPTEKSESEFLDWLVHGDSFFSEKYVMWEYVEGTDNVRKYMFEIRKEAHLKRFYDACKIICKASDYTGRRSHRLTDCKLFDRGNFLCEIAVKPCETSLGVYEEIVVSDELLEFFEKFAQCPSENIQEWFYEAQELFERK